MKKGTVFVFVIMLAIASEATAEQVLNLCVRPNGFLRLAEKCRGREAALTVRIPDPTPPPSPNGGSLHVFDALGDDLGVHVDERTGVYWRFFSVRLGAAVSVRTDPFSGEAGEFVGPIGVLFEEPGCQGRAFLEVNAHELHRVVDTSQKVRWYVPSGEPIERVTPMSNLADQGECFGYGFVRDLAPAVEVDEADLGFSFPIATPLTLRLVE